MNSRPSRGVSPPTLVQGCWKEGNQSVVLSPRQAGRERRGAGNACEGERGKWLQKSYAQGAAASVPISFRVCVGPAICATTIKGVPLRRLHNAQGAAQPAPISFRACVGLAICESRGCPKPQRLSVRAKASAFASNAKRRAYTPAPSA